MKLYTLGTSHGATEVGRACSANLLSVGDAYYLFDCGGNTEGKMTDLGLPIEKIRAVFVTHMHEDHAGTLSAIAKRFCVYHRDASPVSMFLPEENGIKAFQIWLSALHIEIKDRIFLFPVKLGKVYADENITVTAIATAHMGDTLPSFAYIIETEGKKMLYTGDLAGDFHDYPTILSEEDFDAVLCELVHFKVETNLETIAKTKTKKMIFTHLAPRNIPRIRSAEDKLPFSVEIAYDGNCYSI
jgi:ribonuclease BN (tRNA processing enzyme)